MNNIRNVLWGIVLIVIGFIIGLNKLGITDINLFFNGFWTLFIIVPCFIDLFKKEDKTINLIGIVVGILLLLACQGYNYLDIVFELLFPIILISIGLSIILKNTFQKKVKEMKKIKKSDKEVFATFSTQKLDYSDEDFDGCKMEVIFGGIECDLKSAKIEKDVVVDVTAIFGGIDIYVPKDVNIVVCSTSIFGGVDNKTKKSRENEKTIYINATCLFGGVEIK